jgi:hypothetical protein
MFVKCKKGWIQVKKLKMIGRNPTDPIGFINGHQNTPKSEFKFSKNPF